ncbi:MAG: hypothetical protein ACRELA_01190 [Candidatus Rokuibacteriota bacterium]
MVAYSPESYRHLLEVALQRGYRFIGFRDRPEEGKRAIYLRHDVHGTFAPALKIAEVNRALGVQGTFFLLLRSQSYNLLGDWAVERARAIQGLGQRLGLHYVAPAALPPDDGELASLIRGDLELARRQLPELEAVVSFHNPTAELLRRGVSLDVPGIVNTYSEWFVKDVRYYSDSNMRHSVTELEAIVSGGEGTLQLLFHPDHWVPGGTAMLDVLASMWGHVLRELDDEMRSNSVYQCLFPEGLPEHVLRTFVESWREAARKR